jgi:hypothetical protein
MLSREFWLGDNGALVRCIRTAAQSAIAMITVASFSPFSVGAWGNVAVVSGTAALISLLMSLDRREGTIPVQAAQVPAAPAQNLQAGYSGL